MWGAKMPFEFFIKLSPSPSFPSPMKATAEHTPHTTHHTPHTTSERPQFTRYQYALRTIIVIGTFLIASYINAFAAALTGYHTPNIRVIPTATPGGGGEFLEGMDYSRTLPDAGHWMLPEVGDWVNEVLVMCCAYPILVPLLLPFRWMILRRVLSIYSLILITRAVCISATSMPDASHVCWSQFEDPITGAYKTSRMFPKVLERAWQVMVASGQTTTCGDMVFSGHYVAVTMCSLVFKTYLTRDYIKQCPWAARVDEATRGYVVGAWQIWFTLSPIIGFFVIIATRLHYSLDLVIALLITRGYWFVYHLYCQHESLLVTSRVMVWLEGAEMRRHDGVKLKAT